MTEQEFDRALRAALLDAVRADYPTGSEDGPEPLWSARYLRRRRALLADPAGQARRTARPVWRRGLQTAAAVILAAAVSLGAVMSTVPEARAWVSRMFAQAFEQFTAIRFQPDGHPVQDTGYWLPTWLPEGFELAEEHDMGGAWELIFQNAEGTKIYFSTDPMQEGTGFNVDNEHHTQEHITLQGRPALLYRGDSPDRSNILIWSNLTESVAFHISGRVETDILIHMAESVVWVR